MQYGASRLTENERLLYEDICTSNGVVPYAMNITRRQIELLLSIGENIIPEMVNGVRTWKVSGKKKQGGNLTQKFAQKFFQV